MKLTFFTPTVLFILSLALGASPSLLAAPIGTSVLVDFIGYSVYCDQFANDQIRATISDWSNQTDVPIHVTTESLQTACNRSGLMGTINDLSVEFKQSTKVSFARDLIAGENISLRNINIEGNSRALFAAFANVDVSRNLNRDAEIHLISYPINNPLTIGANELREFSQQQKLSLWWGMALDKNALNSMTQLNKLEAFKPFGLNGFLTEAVRLKTAQRPLLQVLIAGEGIYAGFIKPNLVTLKTQYCDAFADKSLQVVDFYVNVGNPTSICP